MNKGRLMLAQAAASAAVLQSAAKSPGTAVKIEPKGTGFRFTRWVRHRGLLQSPISC
jgi:hypothetical protein